MKRELCTCAAVVAALGVVGFAAPAARAQCNGYTITDGGGASIVPGTTDIGNHVDDGYTNIAFPFPISFYGTSYNTANIGSNGLIGFTATTLSFTNACPLTANTVATPYLMPMWDDLFTTDTGNGEGIFSTVSGTAPDRTFYLEWRTVYCCTGGAPVTDFEVAFHEGSGDFEVIYGAADRGSATIGSASGTGQFTQYSTCNTAGVVTPGLVLSFHCAVVPTNPTGVGAVSPASATNCGDQTSLLTVAVTPGTVPPSTGLTVAANLSSIGGDTAQSFYDDGTHGDVTAGDNTFSYIATIASSTTTGAKTFPFMIADAQSRSGSGNITGLTVTTCPSGRCCAAGSCSITTHLACTASGGTWDGTQSSCSLGYTLTQGSASIEPGADDTGNHIDDGLTAVTLPFPVSFYGLSYSSVSASSNGNLQFATPSGTFPAAYANGCLPDPQITGPAIFAFWDDLMTIDAADGNGIFTSTTGSAPNRVFNIEWRARHYNNPNGAPQFNFEVRLFENNSHFEVVFGDTLDSGQSATVGIQDGAGNIAQFQCNTGGANSGTMLSFAAQTGSVCPASCRADIDGNGSVNVQDFLTFLQLYAAADPRADMDNNGAINIQDFLSFLALYAAGCP
jgi:hypothetical protein